MCLETVLFKTMKLLDSAYRSSVESNVNNNSELICDACGLFMNLKFFRGHSCVKEQKMIEACSLDVQLTTFGLHYI